MDSELPSGSYPVPQGTTSAALLSTCLRQVRMGKFISSWFRTSTQNPQDSHGYLSSILCYFVYLFQLPTFSYELFLCFYLTCSSLPHSLQHEGSQSTTCAAQVPAQWKEENKCSNLTGYSPGEPWSQAGALMHCSYLQTT